MTKYNREAWVAQELGKVNAENAVARAASYQRDADTFRSLPGYDGDQDMLVEQIKLKYPEKFSG